MDVKYHGILLGKKGITVKALEKVTPNPSKRYLFGLRVQAGGF